LTTLPGDCRLVMPFIETASIDAVVTDPPYGLKFMGKGWDHGVPGEEFWRETRRTMRPGAFLLAFGGTRTYHRLAVAIEDAGFEILDTVLWLYGSGFPKAKTRLKPAWEPITLARAPGPTRELQINDCRIEGQAERPGSTPPSSVNGRRGSMAGAMERAEYEPSALGRWPANVALDEDAAAMLDEQTGERKAAPCGPNPGKGNVYGGGDSIPALSGVRGYQDTGGASRFFYCAKAGRSERNAGLDGMPERHAPHGNHAGRDLSNPRNHLGGLQGGRAANYHPTVKPIALMRWLVRLITPPGGMVLDPFAGSGTTGIAAALEGREYTGIEQDPEYVEIAERRIAYWSAQPRALEFAL
jgi:hypothetical protein